MPLDATPSSPRRAARGAHPGDRDVTLMRAQRTLIGTALADYIVDHERLAASCRNPAAGHGAVSERGAELHDGLARDFRGALDAVADDAAQAERFLATARRA